MRGPLTAFFGFLGLVAPSRALLRGDAVADVANALVRSTLFNVVTQEQLHESELPTLSLQLCCPHWCPCASSYYFANHARPSNSLILRVFLSSLCSASADIITGHVYGEILVSVLVGR